MDILKKKECFKLRLLTFYELLDQAKCNLKRARILKIISYDLNYLVQAAKEHNTASSLFCKVSIGVHVKLNNLLKFGL